MLGQWICLFFLTCKEFFVCFYWRYEVVIVILKSSVFVMNRKRFYNQKFYHKMEKPNSGSLQLFCWVTYRKITEINGKLLISFSFLEPSIFSRFCLNQPYQFFLSRFGHATCKVKDSGGVRPPGNKCRNTHLVVYTWIGFSDTYPTYIKFQ